MAAVTHALIVLGFGSLFVFVPWHILTFFRVGGSLLYFISHLLGVLAEDFQVMSSATLPELEVLSLRIGWPWPTQ